MHVPAEPIAPWEYIAEELEARGWSREHLAVLMPGDSAVNLCTLDLIEAAVELEEPGLRLGEEAAAAIAEAFGQNKETWLHLDELWIRAIKAKHNGGSS